jgi:chemotaxis protein CheD
MDAPHETSYYLEPGYIYFSKRPATVRTVVGGCVAVCLWDRSLKYGGMNHFMKPVTYDKEQATPQYGNVAVSALIKIMEEAGCNRGDLVAQVLGGGAPKSAGDNHLGKQNVDIAREMLARKGIEIVAEDVGGAVGRKIAFDTGTGQLAVLKVHQLRDSDWLA